MGVFNGIYYIIAWHRHFIIKSSKYLHWFSDRLLLLLLLTALWPYYLASSQLFSGKFSAGKDSQVAPMNLEPGFYFIH